MGHNNKKPRHTLPSNSTARIWMKLSRSEAIFCETKEMPPPNLKFSPELAKYKIPKKIRLQSIVVVPEKKEENNSSYRRHQHHQRRVSPFTRSRQQHHHHHHRHQRVPYSRNNHQYRQNTRRQRASTSEPNHRQNYNSEKSVKKQDDDCSGPKLTGSSSPVQPKSPSDRHHDEEECRASDPQPEQSQNQTKKRRLRTVRCFFCRGRHLKRHCPIKEALKNQKSENVESLDIDQDLMEAIPNFSLTSYIEEDTLFDEDTLNINISAQDLAQLENELWVLQQYNPHLRPNPSTPMSIPFYCWHYTTCQ